MAVGGTSAPDGCDTDTSCFSSLRVRLSCVGSVGCDPERPRAEGNPWVSLGGYMESSRALPEERIMGGELVEDFELKEREGYLLSLKSRSEMARPCWKKLRWRFGERLGETVDSCRAG